MANAVKSAKSAKKPARKAAAGPKAKAAVVAEGALAAPKVDTIPVEIGKTNAALLARREAAVARGVASAAPIFAKYAENAELWDVEGNRYIDFAGGIAVLNTGHRHPKVIEAAKAQEDHYTHTSFQVVPYEPYVALAEKLNALAPGDAPKKSLLVTTGAEAVENAVKIARAYTGPPRRHRLHRRLSWPHPADAGHDRQDQPLQERRRALPRRHLPRPVPVCA